MLGKRKLTAKVVARPTKVVASVSVDDRQAKKARFEELVDCYNKKNEGINNAFIKDCVHACDWCTKTYELDNRVRILLFLSSCRDVEKDCLYFLGGHEREYLAQYHPHNEHCPFAISRFIDLSMIDNSLVPLVITKGLCSPSMIKGIIKDYITWGRCVNTYKNIIKNQFRPISYKIHYNSGMDIFGRLINHYVYTRKRYYQTNTDQIDRGLVTVQACMRYLSDRKKMKVYIGPHNIISSEDYSTLDCSIDTITFRFPEWYFSVDSDDESCYHTANRLNHILAFVNKLRDYFNVRLNLHSCAQYVCDCEDAERLPDLPEPNTILPVKNGQLLKMHPPQGLAALCLHKIKNEWDWRTHNLERLLSKVLLRQYFY